jgi:hypothetical protein
MLSFAAYFRRYIKLVKNARRISKDTDDRKIDLSEPYLPARLSTSVDILSGLFYLSMAVDK